MDEQSMNKKKLFLFWSRSTGRYKKLEKLLKEELEWCIELANSVDDIKLAASTADSSSLAVICLAILEPVGKFSSYEIEQIQEFYRNSADIGGGGARHCLLIARGSDEDKPHGDKNSCNLNELLTASEFGVKFSSETSIIMPNARSFVHPKDAHLEDFVSNRALGDLLARHRRGAAHSSARIVYSRGCSLSADPKRAAILMTSSPWSLPSGQPICVFHEQTSSSRLLAIGCSRLFVDELLDVEDNRALVECLLEVLASDQFAPNMSDSRTMEIPPNNMGPNVLELCNKPVACARALCELPDERASLFDGRLFEHDNTKLALVLRAYKDLRMEPEHRLTLIKPRLEPLSLRDHDDKDAGNDDADRQRRINLVLEAARLAPS